MSVNLNKHPTLSRTRQYAVHLRRMLIPVVILRKLFEISHWLEEVLRAIDELELPGYDVIELSLMRLDQSSSSYLLSRLTSTI